MLQKNRRPILNALALLIPITFLINSCSNNTSAVVPVKKINTVAVPVEKTPLNIDYPPIIELESVKWTIITKENAASVFELLDKQHADVVLFGLTDDNYEILSKNLSHIRNHILQQKEVIKQYKNYYE